MKNFLLTLLVSLMTVSCAHCGVKDDSPYIRTQPGIEYCGQMCDLFQSLDCKPYYENIALEDGGSMTCTEFCEYELKNSVPLNPQCIVDTLTECEQIENICLPQE